MYNVKLVQYALTEYSECTEMHIYNYMNQTDLLSYHKYSNRTFKQSNFTSVLFILEHDASIMGSMKSIIGKNFGQIFEHIWLRPSFDYQTNNPGKDHKQPVDPAGPHVKHNTLR